MTFIAVDYDNTTNEIQKVCLELFFLLYHQRSDMLSSTGGDGDGDGDAE